MQKGSDFLKCPTEHTLRLAISHIYSAKNTKRKKTDIDSFTITKTDQKILLPRTDNEFSTVNRTGIKNQVENEQRQA